MSTGKRSIRWLRYTVQFYFLAFTLFIGWRFSLFVKHFIEPASPFIERPPSVDAFLPIGGFMATKYFLFTGIVDPVHPAGFIIFVAVVLVSLVFKKGFCSWICPVGTISQYTWMAGERIFGRNFTMPVYLDLPLRSLKYILLFLFVLLIGIAMTPSMIMLFMIADYYKIVDVRMMHFFTDMSVISFWVLMSLGVLSLFYKNFWCRYLCPYGALLGLVSMISPVKIRRNAELCTSCGTCTQSCPAALEVEQMETVSSPECMGCLTCVSRCPEDGALGIKAKLKGWLRPLRPVQYVALMLGLFYLIIGIGMATGKWQNIVPYEEYQRIIPKLYAPADEVSSSELSSSNERSLSSESSMNTSGMSSHSSSPSS